MPARSQIITRAISRETATIATAIGLLCLASHVTFAAAAAGDKFFGREVVDSCQTVDESVKSCLAHAFDQLEAANKAVEESRHFLKNNAKVFDLDDELIQLHANLDRKAGLESIITHILREDCNGELESGWDELACRQDAEYIPKFNSSLLKVYRDKITDYLKVDSALLNQEDRVANLISMQAKLLGQLKMQEEQRELIKAGFWLDERYAMRRSSALHVMKALAQ